MAYNMLHPIYRAEVWHAQLVACTCKLLPNAPGHLHQGVLHYFRTQPKNNLKQLLGSNGMRGSGNGFGAGTTRKAAFMGHAQGKLHRLPIVVADLSVLLCV